GNVEMWTLEHFQKLQQRLAASPPYLVSNYTRSTIVRVTLLLAGFIVGIGTAIGDKEETTLASNSLSEILKHLPRDFLKKAYLSHASAPLRGQTYAIEPIAAEDFDRLQVSKQFRTAAILTQ
ncbi:MAG: MnmC family methyltransferase, partial [Proteobacteria bacterium]|nr:MnmC family methyltransferase [Pseudomonadota bacterium]